MVDFDYLIKGIHALSRAHRVNTMAGHLGAAVVAGYFIAEQHPDLDPRVYAGIEGELDRIIRGESVFSPRQNASINVTEMFAPFPAEPARPNLIDGIAAALEQNIGETRESGHNVIFAAIAVRALKDHPDLATPAVTDGIRRLIAGFNGVKPGSGYYGKDRGRIDGRKVPLPEDKTFPPYADLPTMARVVANELIQHAPERRDGFGGLWHVINHGAALAELARHGYGELATKGLPAHHQHVQLWKTVPNVAEELGPETPTPHDPRTSEFWDTDTIRRDRARLDHRIKTLYGFDALVELLEDQPIREQANNKLRYLM
ncbi:MAG: hypothetical protein B7Z55_01075 [Planctomycetales bacterium 12-60-4]|nr:MAG: hypothetical protein B7Z55_01075 [Planctomycetales bacterium 12-60-4]